VFVFGWWICVQSIILQLFWCAHCKCLFVDIIGWIFLSNCFTWQRLAWKFASLSFGSLHFAWVVDHEKCIVVTHVCVPVCLSAATCPHYCTDPDVTWGNGRGCPLVVHSSADLQSVHGLRCYGNTRNVWQSPAVIRQAHRTPHALHMSAKTSLTSNNIDAPVACVIPFHPYCRGVVMRTRNVSEYMLVLALCLVVIFEDKHFTR